jgi:hypothetical protein
MKKNSACAEARDRHVRSGGVGAAAIIARYGQN